jgi:hypothetical protein
MACSSPVWHKILAVKAGLEILMVIVEESFDP